MPWTRHSVFPSRPIRARGHSLVGLLAALSLAGVLSAMAAAGLRDHGPSAALRARGSAAVAFLARARLEAVGRREVVRLRVRPPGRLVLYDARDVPVARLSLVEPGTGLDSVRLAPRTLRFNPRGQASPGSLYLFRAGRGVRVVCNFVGRLRVERFRL